MSTYTRNVNMKDYIQLKTEDYNLLKTDARLTVDVSFRLHSNDKKKLDNEELVKKVMRAVSENAWANTLHFYIFHPQYYDTFISYIEDDEVATKEKIEKGEIKDPKNYLGQLEESKKKLKETQKKVDDIVKETGINVAFR